jgi:hypothetical protein
MLDRYGPLDLTTFSVENSVGGNERDEDIYKDIRPFYFHPSMVRAGGTLAFQQLGTSQYGVITEKVEMHLRAAIAAANETSRARRLKLVRN